MDMSHRDIATERAIEYFSTLLSDWAYQNLHYLLLLSGMILGFLLLSAYYLWNQKKQYKLAGTRTILAVLISYIFSQLLMTYLGWTNPQPINTDFFQNELLLLRNILFPSFALGLMGIFFYFYIPFKPLIFLYALEVGSFTFGLLSFFSRYYGFYPLDSQCMTCPPKEVYSNSTLIAVALLILIAAVMKLRGNKKESLYVSLAAVMSLLPLFLYLK